MVLSSSHHIAKVSFVVLLLCQALDAGHQDIIIAKEVVKQEARQRVAKTLIIDRIQDLNVNRNVQFLASSGTQPRNGVSVPSV